MEFCFYRPTLASAIFLMLFQLFLTHFVFHDSTYPKIIVTIDNRHCCISVWAESLVVWYNWSTHDKHVQAFMTSTRLDRVQSNSVRNSSGDWKNCNSTHITRIVTRACCVKWLLTSITWTVHCPISALIKRRAKFSNVIGCHQPDLSTNRTVSCF